MGSQNNADPRPSPNPWIPILDRLEWLLLLTVLTLAVLAYPLRLQDAWLRAILQTWPGWALRQFESFLGFYHSPLVLKGVLAGLAAIAFVMVRLARLLIQPALAGVTRTEHASTGRWAWVSVAALVGWILASAGWSPTPLLAWEAALWALVYGVFIFVLLRRGLSAAEIRQLGALLLVLGVPVLLIFFLESPVFGKKIFRFMYFFPEMRNRYGTLLGHNIAAASFLMTTAFPCFAFLMTTRRRWIRLALAFYLAAVLVALLILQTRAVWILFPILGLLSVIAAFRTMRSYRLNHLRWLCTILLALVTLGLASQAVDSPWNPFFMRDNPFSRRLKGLSLEGIRTDARTRLDVIGLTLVPKHPLIGHGLYAFQYVYPPRQGEYFVNHPDSKLNQTLSRSDMAHNEYLQVTIDHGLIGLGLMLWALAEIAWRGWKRRRDLAPPLRLLHDAFGWSALGIMLHALVDFPFHVPPVALSGVFCLAAWGSLRPSETFSDILVMEVDEPAENPANGLSDAEPKFRPWAFFRLLGAMLILALIPLVSLPLAMIFQSDVFYVKGNAYFLSAGQIPDPKADSPQEGEALLKQKANLSGQAVRNFNLALRMPNHYLAMAQLGETYGELGRLYAVWVERDKDGRYQRPFASKAVKILGLGLAKLKAAEAGLMNYHVYWLKAQIYRQLDQLQPGRGYLRKYRDNLLQTTRLCPAYVYAAYELAESLADTPGSDLREVIRLRKEILRISPDFFGQYYASRANNYIKDKRYQTAAMSWEQILLCDPARAEWITFTALAEMMAGKRERALKLLKPLRARPGIELYTTGGSIIEAALEQNWGQMLIEFEHAMPEDPAQRAEFRAIEIEAQRRTNRFGEPSHFPCPRKLTGEAWRLLVAELRPSVLLHYFNEPKAARQAMEERLKDAGEPSADFWIEGVYTGLRLGDLDFARACLERARGLDPHHPALPDLKAELERGVKRP